MNADAELAFMVNTVVLFGSFLDPAATTLGDVDVAVELIDRPLPAGVSRQDRRDARVCAAVAAGHRLRSFFDELAWPQDEVFRRLENRSRTLSLADMAGHREFLWDIPHRVIFDLGGPADRR